MDLSNLNRDLNKAQEITKHEQIAFDFYVSSTAISEIVSGFEGTQEGFAQFAKGLSSLSTAIDALEKEGSVDPEQIEILRKISACGGEAAAWSAWDRLISKAYAESDCSDIEYDKNLLGLDVKTLRKLINVCKNLKTKSIAQAVLVRKLLSQVYQTWDGYELDSMGFMNVEALDKLSPKAIIMMRILHEI